MNEQEFVKVNAEKLDDIMNPAAILQELHNKAVNSDSTFGMFEITKDGHVGKEIK